MVYTCTNASFLCFICTVLYLGTNTSIKYHIYISNHILRFRYKVPLRDVVDLKSGGCCKGNRERCRRSSCLRTWAHVRFAAVVRLYSGQMLHSVMIQRKSVRHPRTHTHYSWTQRIMSLNHRGTKKRPRSVTDCCTRGGPRCEVVRWPGDHARGATWRGDHARGVRFAGFSMGLAGCGSLEQRSRDYLPARGDFDMPGVCCSVAVLLSCSVTEGLEVAPWVHASHPPAWSAAESARNDPRSNERSAGQRAKKEFHANMQLVRIYISTTIDIYCSALRTRSGETLTMLIQIRCSFIQLSDVR